MTKFITKNIIVGVFALAFLFGGASIVEASTSFNNDSQDLPTVQVTNYSQGSCDTCWYNSTSANPGDIVSVSIYYHNTGNETAFDTGLYGNQGNGLATIHNMTGSVEAANASSAFGSADIYTTVPTTLTFIPGSASWYPNQAVFNDTSLPYGQNGTEIFGNGLDIGDIQPGWYSQGSLTYRLQVNAQDVPDGNNNNDQTPDLFISTDAYSSIGENNATFHGTVNGFGEGATAWFRWGTTQSLSTYNTTPQIFYGTTQQSFNYSQTLLADNTTYYFKACGSSTGPIVCGSTLSFTTDGDTFVQNVFSPSISTTNSMSVTSNTATLVGTVNSTGEEAVSRSFEYGTNYYGPYTTQNVSGLQNSTGLFNTSLGGLNQNTTYYFKACGQNSAGVDCGGILQFTTNGNNQSNTSLPEVVTEQASNVGQSYATLEGNVTYTGGEAVSRWFEWGTGLGSYTTQNVSGLQNNPGDFSTSISGLQPLTTYYFKACVQNSSGVDCDGYLSFTTYVYDGGNNGGNNSNRPEADTYNATNINENYATLEGRVDGNGTSTTRWFEYGLNSSNLSFETVHLNHGSGDYEVDQYISGLQEGQTYYFRTVAQNTYGTDYGVVRNFSTNGGDIYYGNQGPNALTTIATSIGSDNAVLNGVVVISNVIQTNAFFEYGLSTALGNSTTSINIGSSGSASAGRYVANLVPNATYYFRIVGQNSYGTSYGEIKTFSTQSGSTNTNTNTTTTTTIINNNDNTTIGIGGGDGSLFLALDITPDFENVFPGDVVNFDVVYENVSTGTLRDVIVKVSFPEHIAFRKSTRGFYSDVDKTLTLNIGTLEEDEEGEFLIQTEITRFASNGDVLVTTAEGVHTHPNLDNSQASVIAYALNNVVNNSNGQTLGALAFFAGSFFPTTLWGWLILALIIFFVIMVARRLSNRKYD